MLRKNGDYDDDLFITGDTAKALMTSGTLLVIVDVNVPSYTDEPELVHLASSLVVLDHHRQAGESFENPTLSYVEPFASSTCEMVAEILQYVGEEVRLKSYEADVLYSGIMVDTNNFMNKPGVRTFEAVAFLRRSGADITRIRKLFRTDLDEYKVKAEAIQNTEIFSARSIDELNVQVVMEKLGGGGHITSAGAQLEGRTLQEGRTVIRDILTKMKEEGELQ